jgi:chorismate dehydratase
LKVAVGINETEKTANASTAVENFDIFDFSKGVAFECDGLSSVFALAQHVVQQNKAARSEFRTQTFAIISIRGAVKSFPAIAHGILRWHFEKSPNTLPKLRISVVQYLNTSPLVWGFTHGLLAGKYDLSFTVPSQCAESLRAGDVDIAIIPAIEYQRIDDLVILPDLAIASKRRVRSLLLISKVPLAQAQSIALDRSSRSTQALTKILCARHWRIAPQFCEMAPELGEMLAANDAALLIGDPALHASVAIESAPGFSSGAPSRSDGAIVCDAATLGISGAGRLYVYDVVEQWRAMTGLPAVLAVWAARPAVATPEVVADFHASRAFGLLNLPELCDDAATELQLPAGELQSYLTNNIDFTLDEENVAGLTKYFAEAVALNLIPEAKPVLLAPGPKSVVLEGSAMLAKPNR